LRRTKRAKEAAWISGLRPVSASRWG
jgi:hypothetical protein